jgi:carbon storage regulator CsrA
MLVLTRKTNEDIVIPQYGITITPLQVKGDKVRLGITAPLSVDVYRSEVWEKMQADRERQVEATAAEVPGKRILVVEDNPDCRWGLETLLKMLGYEVESAGDGLEGLEMALRDKPPVLLVDINMPGIDGLELARRLRSQPGFEQAGLVAVTGDAEYQEKSLTVDAGFDACLMKPIDINELRAVLTRIQALAPTQAR